MTQLFKKKNYIKIIFLFFIFIKCFNYYKSVGPPSKVSNCLHISNASFVEKTTPLWFKYHDYEVMIFIFYFMIAYLHLFE